MKLSGKCFCGAVEIEVSGNPEAMGCSADAQPAGSAVLRRRNGSAYAELRYSPACNAGDAGPRELIAIRRER